MPLKKCTADGKAGYQWGDAGKCYTGHDAKKKAIKKKGRGRPKGSKNKKK